MFDYTCDDLNLELPRRARGRADHQVLTLNSREALAAPCTMTWTADVS